MGPVAGFVKRHETWAAVGWFTALVVVFLHDSLLHGTVPVSGDSITGSIPFGEVRPGPGATNNLLGDVPCFFLPMLDLVRDLWRDGTLPLWNPYIMSGVPLLGHAQAGPLSPLNLPIFALPFSVGLTLTVGLKLWLGGMGTYLYARRMGLGAWPGLLAGTAYALCAFQIAWLNHAHTNVTALFPFLILAVEAVVVSGSRRATVGLVLASGALLLGGHPELEMLTMASAALYALVRLVERRSSAPPLPRMGLLALGALGGGLLAAGAIAPFLDALSGSSEASDRGAGGLNPARALAALPFPDFWGNPTGVETPGPSNWNERAFYVGTLPLVLAGLALARWREARALAAIAVCALVALLASSDAGTLGDVLKGVPPFSFTVLARWTVVASFGLAMLAGAGLHAIQARDVTRRQALVTGGVAIAVPLLFVVGQGLSLDTIVETLGGAPLRADSPDLIARLHVLSAGRTLALVVVSLIVLAAASHRARHASVLVGACAALLVAIDLVSLGDGYQGRTPAARLLKVQPSSLTYLQRHQGSSRITASVGSGANSTAVGYLPPNTGQPYGLLDVRGKDHPKDVELVAFWRRLINPAQSPLAALTVDRVDGVAGRTLKLMGVRFLVQGPSDPPPPRGSWREAFRNSDSAIFELRRPLGRVQVPPTAVEVASGDMVERLAAPSFDPRRVALVDFDGAEPPTGPVEGSAKILRTEANRVSLEARLDRRGVVVLADSFARGWRVEVDGRPAKALRANSLYRAVAVPPGLHRIEWVYRPLPALIGLGVSLLTAATLLAAGGVALARRRRRRPTLA